MKVCYMLCISVVNIEFYPVAKEVHTDRDIKEEDNLGCMHIWLNTLMETVSEKQDLTKVVSTISGIRLIWQFKWAGQ